ncbi:MAG: aldehyde ferredoxin oxidoreductase N-terminal domain-containing protein [Candidatus Binatia bacterium]
MGAVLLRVNLSNGKLAREPIAEALVRQFIGGRGLVIKLLTHRTDARPDACDAANPLIFATGPLTATFAPTGGRYMIENGFPFSYSAR